MSKRKKKKGKSGKRRDKAPAKSRAEAPPKLVKDVTGEAQWRSHVLESEKPVVVDFWAPWCGPCKMMTPIIEEVSKSYKDSVSFAKLNTQSNAQIARNLNIRSIPTLIVFYQGEVFDVSIGVTPAGRLHKMIRRVLDKQEGVGMMEKFKRIWRKTDRDQGASEDAEEDQ